MAAQKEHPFAPAPPPPTELGRYRILSKTSGLRVSPLCLGAMSIGEAWADTMGAMTKKQSFELLDAFSDAGGNFIDTANGYHDGESEEWLGEWMAARGNRDEMVIATKFTGIWKKGDKKIKKQANYGGNSAKSLQLSLRDSLVKLKTDYIDILYVHWWDWTTSIEDLMQHLADVVRSGKVLYLGISDAPAWVVSKANTYARCHALPQFVVYQGKWSVTKRDFEREIIPMCLAEGMALAPWGSMGGGKYQSAGEIKKRESSGEPLRSIAGPGQTELDKKASEVLEEIGKEVGTDSVQAVALAYVMSKTAYVFPIIGGRKVEHLKSNLAALSIRLTPEQIGKLEAIEEFDLGFPSSMIGQDIHITGQAPGLMNMTGHYSLVKQPVPINAAQ